jgi:hypothetical protein
VNQPSQSAAKPSILFVYFTYTKQTLRVLEAMAEVLRGRGCDVTLAAIGFTDPRYLGVKIPPTNIQDYHLKAARKLADGLANRLPAGARQPPS